MFHLNEKETKRNQIVCEICGSNELIKQDGIFICRNCGAKYSTEEAKKMVVEIDASSKSGGCFSVRCLQTH